MRTWRLGASAASRVCATEAPSTRCRRRWLRPKWSRPPAPGRASGRNSAGGRPPRSPGAPAPACRTALRARCRCPGTSGAGDAARKWLATCWRRSSRHTACPASSSSSPASVCISAASSTCSTALAVGQAHAIGRQHAAPSGCANTVVMPRASATRQACAAGAAKGGQRVLVTSRPRCTEMRLMASAMLPTAISRKPSASCSGVIARPVAVRTRRPWP